LNDLERPFIYLTLYSFFRARGVRRGPVEFTDVQYKNLVHSEYVNVDLEVRTLAVAIAVPQ